LSDLGFAGAKVTPSQRTHQGNVVNFENSVLTSELNKTCSRSNLEATPTQRHTQHAVSQDTDNISVPIMPGIPKESSIPPFGPLEAAHLQNRRKSTAQVLSHPTRKDHQTVQPSTDVDSAWGDETSALQDKCLKFFLASTRPPKDSL